MQMESCSFATISVHDCRPDRDKRRNISWHQLINFPQKLVQLHKYQTNHIKTHY